MDRSATSQAVAAALNVQPTTVQRYARDGRIPFDVTPGGHRRFNVDEVRSILITEERKPVRDRFTPLKRSLNGARAVVPKASSSVTLDETLRAAWTPTDLSDVVLLDEAPALDVLMSHTEKVGFATLRG